MNGSDAEKLVEIRTILSHLHDRRVTRNAGLSLTEMAALRDCVRRINDVLSKHSKDKQ